MQSKIEPLIRFGLPVIAVLITIYAVYLDRKHPGDPEFGAIGQGGGLMLLLAGAILLLLLAGIIVWIVTRKSFIFQSALFSGIAVFLVIFTSIQLAEYKRYQRSKKNQEKHERELKLQKSKIESLTAIIDKSPDNYKALEKRALLYMNMYIVYYPDSEEYKSYIEDLELVATQKTSNVEVYLALAKNFGFHNEFEKAVAILQSVLQSDSAQEMNLSAEEQEKVRESIEHYRKLQQQSGD
jgi:hypothetical protein